MDQVEFIIRGRQQDGRSVKLATTTSARKAQKLRDAPNAAWAEVTVSGPDGVLTEAELDMLAYQEPAS